MKSDEPITGPPQVGADYPWEPDWDRPVGPSLWLGRYLLDFIRKPAHWIRENVVEPNRGPKYYWYHKKFKRALPVDECYLDDLACLYEADVEYKRNMMIDRATVDMLIMRRDRCWFWHSQRKGGMMKIPAKEECDEIAMAAKEAQEIYDIKYGEQHFDHTVTHAYNRQKVRMIAERRREEARKYKEGSESDA